ncbi:hypothetical protein KM043_018887, partial [Ampulex compressa]
MVMQVELGRKEELRWRIVGVYVWDKMEGMKSRMGEWLEERKE